MKIKILIIILGIASNLICLSQTYSGPESCEYDYSNNRWLVGNKNNGTVVARYSNGSLSVFCSGMNSGPYGIEILGNTLYCCYGGGKIRGYNLNDGSQVFDLNLGGQFLNGITSDGDSILYITDFSDSAIYALNVNTLQYGMITKVPRKPNGIIYDGTNQRCIFVTWGTGASIMELNLNDSSVTTLVNTPYNNLDGITRDGNGNFYISAWSNQSVIRYSSNLTNPTIVASGLSNPADIFYNVLQDTLGIPNSGTANNLVLIGFGTPTTGNETINESQPILFYPNPALHYINLNRDVLKVVIYELDGKIVAQLSQSQGNCMNISELSKGNYLIELQLKNGDKVTSTLIKQ
ncbi:MAG: T9SS type A sorting domain-containing protein [Flavobacteriales bacterium]|nr:T9SS type A sorting domain-containing protein [Flavobacteriales bacterium]